MTGMWNSSRQVGQTTWFSNEQKLLLARFGSWPSGGLRAGKGPAGLGRGPGLALGRQSKVMQKPKQELRGLAGVPQSFS